MKCKPITLHNSQVYGTGTDLKRIQFVQFINKFIDFIELESSIPY
jgi:hypothetical protein